MLFLLFSLLSPNVSAQSTTIQDSLVSLSENILGQIKNEDWSGFNCIPFLNGIQYQINAMNTVKPSRAELKSVAAPIMENLWQSRLALHDHIQPALSDACVKEIRNTFRQFRFIEDMLGEIEFDVENINPFHYANKEVEDPITHVKTRVFDKKHPKFNFENQKVPIDETTNGYLLQKNVENFDFKEGDIIIARGVSFLSAMIARLGDTDSQFSHVVLWAKEPITGEMHTIESYVGSGVSFFKRDEALKNENSRLLVLRAKNPETARHAAEKMRAYVSEHKDANRLRYDYALDFTNHDTYSCAEVSQVAFEWADPSFHIPERASNLSHGLNLLQNLGVKPGATFTPGDLESDSRFEIVAEWRDLRITRDSRIKDTILSKVFEWMDNKAFKLQPTLKSKLAKGLIYDLRHTFAWPVVRKLMGIDDFSAEVPRAMLSTVAIITELGEGVQKELEARDEAYFNKTGLRMTYLDLYKELDQMLETDQEIFKKEGKYKNTLILKYLHP